MPNENDTPAVYLIHPEPAGREQLRAVIARHGFHVRDFPSADAFFDDTSSGCRGCLVIDLESERAYELLTRMRTIRAGLPAIMIAERGDVSTAVRAMRAGAGAFIEKPFAQGVLIREIRRLFA